MSESVKDVRTVLYKAISALNESKLSPKHIPLPDNIYQLSEDELSALANQFLDAVELIPVHCEPDIPDEVVRVYNDIVAGRCVIFSNSFRIDGRPVLVQVDKDMAFVRTHIPEEEQEEQEEQKK